VKKNHGNQATRRQLSGWPMVLPPASPRRLRPATS
jgi:hypothetical protein